MSEIRQLLENYFHDAKIPKSGLDSLALAGLVVFIQQKFNVALNLEDVLEKNNFRSVDSVEALIKSRKN